MTQLGLSYLDMFGMAFLVMGSLLAVEFGLFVRPELRVTTMNGAWPQTDKDVLQQASAVISFKA